MERYMAVGRNDRMTLQNFIGRLNWRQVLIHFVAFWFFIHAFGTLIYLYDIKLMDIARNSSDAQVTKELNQKMINHYYFADYLALYPFFSGLFGLLTAFIISLAISIKRHWFWFNSLIVFFLTFFLFWRNSLGWTFFRPFCWYPGQMFRNTIIEFMFNGVYLLAIGILLFSLKRISHFIDGREENI